MNYSDLYLSIYFILSLVFLLIFLDYLYRKSVFSHFVVRKIAHAAVGILIVLSSFYFQSNLAIVIIASLFTIVNLFSIVAGKLTSIHGQDKSLGTVYYPLSVLILAIFFWDENILVFRVALLIMSVPDVLAAVFGVKFGKNKFILIKDNKSYVGAATMFLSSAATVAVALIFSTSLNTINIVTVSVCIALVAAASELLSINGSDNLSVPLFSALFLLAFLTEGDNLLFSPIVLGIFFSLLLVIISYNLKFLNLSGAVTTFLLGSIIFGLGGVIYTIPILAFFVSSSFLSAYGKQKKQHVEKSYEKTGTRDYAQVMANGGIAGIIVILNYFFVSDSYFIIYLAVIAAVTADTWATELGFFSKKLPRLITNFKQSPKGTSGAISITGTISSIFASLMIAFLGHLLAYDIFTKYGIFVTYLIVIVSGFSACLVDSLLGATVQAQYFCSVCHTVTEKQKHCNQITDQRSGYRFINNDAVNFIASIFSVCFALILFSLV